MMMHEAAFLKAIIDQPDDDGLRLIAADFLDETGQPERSEFIRVQVALARIGCSSCIPSESGLVTDWACDCDERRTPLRGRERALLLAHGVAWLTPPMRQDEFSTWDLILKPGYIPNGPGVEYHRGFIEFFVGTAADWLAHADALTTAAPIREVRLTTWPAVLAVDAGHINPIRGVYYQLDGMPLGSLGRMVRLEESVSIDARRTAAARLLRAHWPRIAFTLPPVAAFPGNLEETTAMIRDEIIRGLGIPRDMIR